jgi:glycosyltransferase involved in cell wall biosynthesis
MKILQINCVYKQGSTGKIVYDLHSELKRHGIESVVCYGRGARVREPGVYKTCGELYSKLNNLLSRFTGMMYGGCFFSTRKLIGIIKKERPDVVHLHCLNGYFVNIYRLLEFLKDSGIKTVLTLHAEFMHTGNCGHALDCERWLTGCGKCPRLRKETKSLIFDRTHSSWGKMYRAFAGFEKLTVASVSPWLMERARLSPILSGKMHAVVLNGVDTGIFHPYDNGALREKHGLKNEKAIFHATAYFSADPNHIKGGYYVLELAKMLLAENVRFFVAGACDPSIVPPENVTLLGRVSDQALLARYYSMADVTLLTSRKETFSMICAESLCCGTPVAGFKAGGPESIAMPEYSEFVEYGDLASLFNEINDILNNRSFSKFEAAKTAAVCYSKAAMTNKYITLYEGVK